MKTGSQAVAAQMPGHGEEALRGPGLGRGGGDGVDHGMPAP